MKTEHLLLVKFHKFYNTLPKGRDSQGRILKILSHHDGISQRKLQEIVGIKPGSLSEVLLKLEKMGYIMRKQEKNDKRRQDVYITDAGRTAFEEIHKEHEWEAETVFEKLTPAEKQSLLSILDKLTDDENAEHKHQDRLDNNGEFELE